MKNFLKITILLMLLSSCTSGETLDAVRQSIEKTDSLIVDYKFCAYKEDELFMQQKMYAYIVKKDDRALFSYFGSKNIHDKKMIAKIICRFLCRVHENFNRPSNTLSQKIFFGLLDDCTTEIVDEYYTEVNSSDGTLIYLKSE